MLSELLTWGLIAGIYALAFGVLALPKHWYRTSQWLFIGASVLADLKIVHWALTSTRGFRLRVGLASFGLLTTTGVLIWFVRKVQMDLRADQTAKAAESPSWSDESQQALVENLKSYANQHSNVKVKMANQKHIPLVESLASIFSLAGWQVSLTNVPLEQYIHDRFFTGIEVKGYNKHLVETVAANLSKAGLKGITSVAASHEIKPDNPKWKSVEHSIYITVGHTD